jgi:hypothetical protein
LAHSNTSASAGCWADGAPAAANGRLGEFFWLMMFFVVMGTSLLAAARRWAGHLRRAAVPQARRRA